MSHPSNRKHLLLSGLFWVIVMAIPAIYSNSDGVIHIAGHELKKSDELKFPQAGPSVSDTSVVALPGESDMNIVTRVKDTSSKRILLIGDSQVEGLRFPFAEYCQHNGHTLLQAFIWYSSTDKTYGSNDTLKRMIAKFRPDYIVMVIGLNQLFQSSFDESERAVGQILSDFGEIPYSWIGPANWTKDKGINALYERIIPKDRFFRSADLKLSRAKDGRHPGTEGNRMWMDSIAVWMDTRAYASIKMGKPDSSRKMSVPTRTLTVR